MQANLMSHALDVLSLFKSVDRNTFVEVMFHGPVSKTYEEFLWKMFTNEYFSFLVTLEFGQFQRVHEYCMERYEIAEDDLRDM